MSMRALRERLLGEPPSGTTSTEGIERQFLRRRIKDPRWTIDRGAGYFAQERAKRKLSYLVETGR